MHEFSLVEALVEAVEAELRSRPGARLRAVSLRIGELRQVEPSTMEFCWEAAIQETPLAGARLRIERVEARARCPKCRAEFAVRENWFECPACRALGGEVFAGRELSLVALEIDPAP